MDNRQKTIIYTTLAAIFSAITAIFAAQQSIGHIFIVLPLVLMGICLFFAGYYAGQGQHKR